MKPGFGGGVRPEGVARMGPLDARGGPSRMLVRVLSDRGRSGAPQPVARVCGCLVAELSILGCGVTSESRSKSRWRVTGGALKRGFYRRGGSARGGPHIPVAARATFWCAFLRDRGHSESPQSLTLRCVDVLWQS